MINGKYEKAVDAFKKLGLAISVDELKAVQFRARAKLSKGAKRAFLIVALFMTFQQITGINVPFYYGPIIISKLNLFGSSTSLVTTQILSVLAATILAIINVAATYIGFKLIDTAGRRTLAVLGYSGMAIFGFAGALLRYANQDIGMLIALSLFIVFFAFGVGGTGWIIQGEYFPTEYRGTLASLIAFVDWISNFAIVEIFPYMDKTIHIAGSLLVFGSISVIAALIFYVIMPVTKGKSVEEITKMFDDMAK